MKKKLLLFSLLSIFSFQLFAQTVPQEQRTLITKITASWCPTCGGWGWTMFENLLEDNEEKAVLIANHYDGSLSNTTSDQIAENWNTFSQPRFYVGDTDQGVTSSNSASKRTAIKSMVDANFMEMPLANAGIEASISNNLLLVNTKTKFFQSASGEYYLGVYVVENDFVHNQAGLGANAVHQKLMRGAVTSETFGELLMNGSISMNMEFDKSFTMILDSEWDINNLEIVTIIWKKENDTYSFVNTNIISDIEATTSIGNILLQNTEMKVIPTIVSAQANVFIDLKNELTNASLQVFDLEGKKVLNLFQGNLSAGNNNFTLDRKSDFSKGIYFVVLQSNQKVISQKVIFE